MSDEVVIVDVATVVGVRGCSVQRCQPVAVHPDDATIDAVGLEVDADTIGHFGEDTANNCIACRTHDIDDVAVDPPPEEPLS